MTTRLTVAAVLDEAAAPPRRVRPRDLRRLAARRRGADPPVAGVDAQRVLERPRRRACWRRASATAGAACPPTSATGPRRARRTSPGPRCRRPATTAPTRSGSTQDELRAPPGHSPRLPGRGARGAGVVSARWPRNRSRSCSPAAAHAAPTRPGCCRCCCPRCRRAQRPNLIVGASVGAVNGAYLAATLPDGDDPALAAGRALWEEMQLGRRAGHAVAARPRAARPRRAELHRPALAARPRAAGRHAARSRRWSG